MINNLINMELNFVNTNHPDFKLDEVIGTVMQKRSQHQQAITENEVSNLTIFCITTIENCCTTTSKATCATAKSPTTTTACSTSTTPTSAIQQ
jgi:hypothetical protein